MDTAKQTTSGITQSSPSKANIRPLEDIEINVRINIVVAIAIVLENLNFKKLIFLYEINNLERYSGMKRKTDIRLVKIEYGAKAPIGKKYAIKILSNRSRTAIETPNV